MPGYSFGIVNEDWLCGFVQVSITDGYFYWEFQSPVFEIWWTNDGLQLIFLRLFAVFFHSLVKIEYFPWFGSDRKIVLRGKGQGIELGENGGCNFEHVNNLYYL